MSLFVFIAFFTFITGSHKTLAQVPEITGSSTDELLVPGINIDAGSNPAAASLTTERSRYGSYERAIIKAVDQINSQTEAGAELKYNYTVQIITGELKDKTYTVRSSPENNITPGSGDIIMVFIQPGGSEQPKIFFETFDRKNLYIFSLAILILLLLILFGLRGLIIACGVALSLWLAIYTTLPLYLRDWPLLLVIAIASLLMSLTGSLLLFGWHKKVITTTIATVLGTTISAIIAQLFASTMHLTVALDTTGKAFFTDHPTIMPSKILVIGLILACFAIIQDISSSISCGVAELKKIRQNTSWKDLFTSGMNIGRTHAATMLLVLLLAWVGGSIHIFLFRYQNDTGWLHFLNQDIVSSVFLLAIAGTIGVIISIPISALVVAIAWTRITPPEDPTKPVPSWKINNQ